MCLIVTQAVNDGNQQVIEDVQRIAGVYEKKGWLAKTPQELYHNLLHTFYTCVATQSSQEMRERNKELSESIGSYHDQVYNAHKTTFTRATDFHLQFAIYGGSVAENIALQNIQSE